MTTMFGKLFGPAPPVARAPEGVRIYAVGDIHGCADLLDRLMDLIAMEETPLRKQLIFLGDYGDRGPDSRGVLDRLLEIGGAAPETVFLKGNHEAALLGFLDDPAANADWIDWGGAELLASYGTPPTGPLEDMALALREAIPAEHLDFLKSLELHRVMGDYLFVHAGLRPGVPLADQTERDLIWIRGEFHRAPAELRPKETVVHGHQPLKKPLDAGWRIDVDTGACFTGKLTAAVLEGATRRFLST